MKALPGMLIQPRKDEDPTNINAVFHATGRSDSPDVRPVGKPQLPVEHDGGRWVELRWIKGITLYR